MKSVTRSIGTMARPDRISQAVRGFEVGRQRDEALTLDSYLQGVEASNKPEGADLAALVKSELRARFARGESPAVAEYLARYPELRKSDSRVLSLIYEEYCLRQEAREEIGVESFCDRYPEWKDSLASQLQYHQLISQAAGLASLSPAFPRAGETFGEFDLISLLGTGGSSRVFIARDTSLGDREVVLKVAVDRGNEPKILGGLVHPRIVWVNSVSYQPETQLRGLSMPYHPGLPLDEILKKFESGPLPSEARVFWDVLDGVSSDRGFEEEANTASPAKGTARRGGGDVPVGDGWKGFPFRGTYAQGVAWIGRVLAEALHYAHTKEVFHRDIKPGNVLITRSRGPQLLDFNLAQSPHSAERAEEVLHGGTLPYMAPEQIKAFLDPACWGDVGASADLYSLGLVLRELLTRQLPGVPADNLPRSRALADFLDRRAVLDPSVRHENPSVPYALEAIVARCLAYDPGDRYASAAELAEDLRNFLEFRPLKVAKNPSLREKAENWLGRRRRLVECTLAVVIGMSTVLQPVPIDRSPALRRAVSSYSHRQFDEAITALNRLTESYPSSPLPRFFLALARNTRGDDFSTVEPIFEKAMSRPDAQSTLAAWALDHPSVDLLSGLDQFAKRCFENRKSYSKPAEQAIHLSLAINPSRPETMVYHATLEESLEHYDKAYEIISKRIADFQGKRQLLDRSESSRYLNSYLPLLLSRSRIALRRAEQLASGSAPAGEKAQVLLRGAIEDLEAAEKVGIHDKDLRFTVTYWRVKSLLLLIEAELRQDSISEANRRLGEVRVAYRELMNFGEKIPSSEAIARQIDLLDRRIQAATAAKKGKELFSGVAKDVFGPGR